MGMILQSELKAGVIYGDNINNEYVYMPASEIGVSEPICVFETADKRLDVSFKEALTLVRRLSLKPAKHPLLGRTSC